MVWTFPPVILVKFWIVEHFGLQIRDIQPVLLSSCETTWVCIWEHICCSHYRKTEAPFWGKCLESMAAMKRVKAQTQVKQMHRTAAHHVWRSQQEALLPGRLSEGREALDSGHQAQSRQSPGRNENRSRKWKGAEQNSSFPLLWGLEGWHQASRNLHQKGCRSPKHPAEACWWVTPRPSGTHCSETWMVTQKPKKCEGRLCYRERQGK